MDKDINFFFCCIISESESSREDTMKRKRQGKSKALYPFPRNCNYLKVTSFGPVSNMPQASLQRVSHRDSNV